MNDSNQPKYTLTSFIGGSKGLWTILSMENKIGDPLERVEKINITNGAAEETSSNKWILCGTESNLRYTHRTEKNLLDEKSPTLGRNTSSFAALIPIKKSDEWWSLPQDERRKIFEETSRHIKTGLSYLPTIARRLYHSRDIGEAFDFLTWFEFYPPHSIEFDKLLAELRGTEEWKFVVREIDIRLSR